MDLNSHKENEILRSLIDQLANNPELQDWAKGLTDEERDFYGRENVPNNIAEHIVLLSIIEQITLQEALQMAKRNVAIAVERKKLIESLTEIMETIFSQGDDSEESLADACYNSDDCECNYCDFSNPDGECQVGGKCRCDGRRILH